MIYMWNKKKTKLLKSLKREYNNSVDILAFIEIILHHSSQASKSKLGLKKKSFDGVSPNGNREK